MEAFLDTLWFKIEVLVQHIKAFLDAVLAPLNAALGPAWTILILAFLTVLLAEFLARKFNTKRYRMLKGQFQYWYNLRQEANSCDDTEKAKLLKRNIDQAELNRVYYDYFFEGLMKSLLTRYLPLFLMLAYVNEAYKANQLMNHFGRAYVLKLPATSGKPLLIGAVFWFFLCIVLAYGFFFFLGRIIAKVRERQHPRQQL
jgi:uncharacterized membrane protein (DUF106 family)